MKKEPILLEKSASKCLQITNNHSKAVFWLFLLLLVASGPLISQVQIDNTLEKIMEPDPQLMAMEKNLKEKFGNFDELTVIAYYHPQLFTPEPLKRVKSLTRKILKIKGVQNCLSLANVPWFRNQDFDGERVLMTSSFLKKTPKSKKDLKHLQESASSNPLYRRNLISADGNTVAFNVILERDISSEDKEQIIKKLMTLTDQYQKQDNRGRFYISGMHVFMEFTSNFLRHDLALFTVLTVIAILLTLFLCFGNIKPAILCLLGATITNGLSLAVINTLGMRFSVATSAFPAIAMALTAAYSIHVIHAVRAGEKPGEMKEILSAILLAGVTTTAGFISLALNPVVTVQEFGIFTAIGVFWATLVSCFFVPATIKAYPWFIGGQGKTLIPLAFISRFSSMVINYRGRIVLISALLALLVIFAFTMKIDTDYYKYYNQKTALTEAIDFTNKHLAGQYPFVIMLEDNDNDDAFLQHKNLQKIKELRNYLASQPGVDSVVDYAMLLDDAYQAMADQTKVDPSWSKNSNLVSQVAMLLNDSAFDVKSLYITDDYNSTAMVVRTNLISSRDFLDLVDKVEIYLAENKNNFPDNSITGTYIRCTRSADRMAFGQIWGSFFAILIVMTLVFVAIKDWRLTSIAFFPNILPLLLIFGIMGLLGETINMGTATIAAISIGIAVDDTIHFLVRYRYAAQSGLSSDKVASKTIETAGPSITFTTITIAAGFLVLYFSSFAPVSKLGLYTAITMLLCMLSDLLFLPALLLYLKTSTNQVKSKG